MLAAPQDFTVSRLTLSNCPSGRHGGSLGQLGRGETVAEFGRALLADGAPGILPHLVRARFGFHIVAIDRRVQAERLPFKAVRERTAQALSERAQRLAMRQHVRLLAGRAEAKGIDPAAVETPLVQ
ncbi:MAG: peptidylprolyl isomerase [Acetobacteraceae bacterium]